MTKQNLIALLGVLVICCGCATTRIQSTSGWTVASESVAPASASLEPLSKQGARTSASDVKRAPPKPKQRVRKAVRTTAISIEKQAEKTPPASAQTIAMNPPAPNALATEPALGVAAADQVMASAEAKPRVANEANLIFDYPVTYNARVRKWIKYFQTSGRPSFRRWLERSSRFIPAIQDELAKANLPLDLAYVAMIESGFSSIALSHASALGMWQFIAPTGQRYGLEIQWWIDERRDFEKSTKAAIAYMTDLYSQFGSWYLVAASYNMGENGVRRVIRRHKTNSFWELADRGAIPEETRNYVPKMLAAMLISKAPALYGFRDLQFQIPYAFDFIEVPGGTDLINLAGHLGVSERSLTELNPELLKAFIPREVKSHRIRIPKGSKIAVSQYVNGEGRTVQ